MQKINVGTNRSGKQTAAVIVFFVVALSLFSAVLLSSCDAPRNNPLDPDNPNSELGVLEGSVHSESVPRRALHDVAIIKDGTVLGMSSASGTFRIENVRPTDGWLHFQKNGYKTDSVLLSWNGGKQAKIEMFLNSIPVLDSLKMYSIVLSRFSLPSLKTVMVSAYVSDPDKDIDSVFIYSKDLNILRQLPYNQNNRTYERQFLSIELNVEDAELVTGINLSVIVKDVSGSSFTVGSGAVKRFLSQPMSYISPSNLDTVTSRPTLSWQDYSPGFSFTQIVQVYTNEAEINPVLVWERDDVQIDSTAVQVGTTLPAGNYFWVIWAVDLFSNRIRSNQASFYVKGQ